MGKQHKTGIFSILLQAVLAFLCKPRYTERSMPKASIHPEYKAVTISCACGATYETASTRESFMVEICSSCHPFFTGKQKLVDSAGRIERFQRRFGLKTEKPAEIKE